MKLYNIKIVAYANYPIEGKKQVEASNFSAALGKALNEFWDDQSINTKRRRKIKNINLSIQKV